MTKVKITVVINDALEYEFERYEPTTESALKLCSQVQKAIAAAWKEDAKTTS
jgi:hypothetical protein